MTPEAIAEAIAAERARQHKLWDRNHPWGWGDCSSTMVEPITKVAVLAEEVGEVARAVLADDEEATRTELVQVAAVAIAWLEAIA